MDEPGKQDVTLAELHALIAAHVEWERGFFTKELPLLVKDGQPLTPPACASEILSSIYYGGYEPEVYKSRALDRTFSAALEQAHNALLETLSPQGKEALNEYMDILAARGSAVAEQAYESGFRTAVQLLVAGLTNPGK